MFLFWKKRFDPAADNESIIGYVEDVLKPQLKVESGTPPLFENLPAPERFARRRVEFGRGRDYEVFFYPTDRKYSEADERVYLNDIVRKRVPVPKLVFEDRTPQTRKKYSFDVVVCQRQELRPLDDAWTVDDLRAIGDTLRQLNSISNDMGGKPWRPDNAEVDYLKATEQRWTKAVETVASGLGRRIHPKHEPSFCGKAFGYLEIAGRYDLIHGAPGPRAFQRPVEGGVQIVDFSNMQFSYREWDLVLLEQIFFGGDCPASRSMLTYYLQQTTPQVQKRFEQLKPFFTGLYFLEKMAESVPPSAEKSRKEKVKPLTAAEQMEIAARRAEAGKLWAKFLEATGLPER